MPLMRISEYRDTFSPASRPDPRTVISWVQAGELYGERRGRTWYVDPARSAHTHAARPRPASIDTTNPLVARVLRKG